MKIKSMQNPNPTPEEMRVAEGIVRGILREESNDTNLDEFGALTVDFIEHILIRTQAFLTRRESEIEELKEWSTKTALPRLNQLSDALTSTQEHIRELERDIRRIETACFHRDAVDKIIIDVFEDVRERAAKRIREIQIPQRYKNDDIRKVAYMRGQCDAEAVVNSMSLDEKEK